PRAACSGDVRTGSVVTSDRLTANSIVPPAPSLSERSSARKLTQTDYSSCRLKEFVGIRRLALAAATASVTISATPARLRTDPAVTRARVRVMVPGTAATTDVTVSGATLASYTSTILRAASGSGTSQTGATMRMSNGGAGQTAEAQFDAILSDVQPAGSVV